MDPLSGSWKLFQTLTVEGGSGMVSTARSTSDEWVKLEVKPLKPLGKDWYRAGYLSQTLVILGHELSRIPSITVPFGLSVIHLGTTTYPYRLRFSPVPWLPRCTLKIHTAPADLPNSTTCEIDGGEEP
jgi:hypothetical protein